MIKLLIDTPPGRQEIIKINPGGGYFDPARVLWDERVDGTLPDNITAGGMIRNGGALEFNQSRLDAHTAATRPTVPAEVTMRQARLALASVGLLDAVSKAISEIEDATQKKAAQIEWEYSAAVRRRQPLVLALAPALGLDDAALDQLFVAAGAL